MNSKVRGGSSPSLILALGHMSILKKVLIFCFGVPFGIYIAFYLVVAGSNRTFFGRLTGFIETPFL